MSKSHYSAEQRKELISKLIEHFGNQVIKDQILEFCDERNLPNPHFLVSCKDIKVGKIYNLDWFYGGKETVNDTMEELLPAMQNTTTMKPKRLVVDIDNTVPDKDVTYVPFGFFKPLEQIIKSKIFFSTFVTGLSGNGKTTMVEQVCAKTKRECIRVNISIETDEEDLIGGNTLQDGNIVYREGPVLTAMRRGAILLIDEIDRGSNKLMCLQSVLEGKPYFNKKTGEVIHPAPGFNVIATANTKGRGTEDGRFIAAQILDEAFLERFSITVEQEYPSVAIEKKIVLNKMEAYGKLDSDFADKLIAWADIIRKTFEEGGVDEIISTRRLVNIVQAYSIFNDRLQAIQYCINRFDEDTKTAFLDLYNKMNVTESTSDIKAAHPHDEEIPF